MPRTTSMMRDRWAVVLAAGEGRRLAPITRALYGEELPKQFASFVGERTLLQATLDRIGDTFARERTVVVVSEDHARVARRQLSPYHGVEVVVQPRNLGTGPGVLLPVARVLARDPEAAVAVFPSDHDVLNPGPLLDGIATAIDSVLSGGPALALLGIVPEGPESEYGWIVPGRRNDTDEHSRPLPVETFVEKPAPDLAARLLAQGGLWNSFLLVGRARSFFELAGEHLPRQAALLREYAQSLAKHDEEQILDRAYRSMPAADFSRSLLERARGLGVVPVAGSGWCDWGTPVRLFRGLRSRAALAPLLARIRDRARCSAATTTIPDLRHHAVHPLAALDSDRRSERNPRAGLNPRA